MARSDAAARKARASPEILLMMRCLLTATGACDQRTSLLHGSRFGRHFEAIGCERLRPAAESRHESQDVRAVPVPNEHVRALRLSDDGAVTAAAESDLVLSCRHFDAEHLERGRQEAPAAEVGRKIGRAHV